MLDRFTSDLDKLAVARGGSGGYRDLIQALIAFAMEKYYVETADSPKYRQELFQAVTGGLQFDTKDIAADITGAKGYSQYFSKFLETDPLFSFRERSLIRQSIADLRDWSVAVGAAGMTVTDANNRGTFMLGGDGSDTFTGGTTNDLLVGGFDNDILSGGVGADLLIGGDGFDTYHVDEGDTIYDRDGSGTVYLGQDILLGGKWDKQENVYVSRDGRYRYQLSGTDLSVNNGQLVIADFRDGNLGIKLDKEDQEKNPRAPDRLGWGDMFDSSQYHGTPIILDLDGDGVETIAALAGAHFDHDGNGFAEATGWASSDDGLLVWDRNGNGRIDDGSELFGNRTRLRNGNLAQNGFTALADQDDNLDGRIDASDAAWANLRMWRDRDMDGYTDAAELVTLEETGVTAVNTAYTETCDRFRLNWQTDAAGNEHRQIGSFIRADGSTGIATDVWFRRRPIYAIDEHQVELTPEVATLPEVRASGNVRDLRQAMMANPDLVPLVQQFATESSPAAKDQLLEQILFKWTGSEEIDPASRGELIDARILGVVEGFCGHMFVQIFNQPGQNNDPNAQASRQIKFVYDQIFEYVNAEFMAQTHLAPLVESIGYSHSPDGSISRMNFDSAIEELRNRLAEQRAAGLADVSSFVRMVMGWNAEDFMDYAEFFSDISALGADAATLVQEAISRWGEGVDFGYMTNDGVFRGGFGNDRLSAGDGNNWIEGRYGNDTLQGLSGDDTLIGGQGNDYLEGDDGNDTYIFSTNFGIDTILDGGWISENLITTEAQPVSQWG